MQAATVGPMPYSPSAGLTLRARADCDLEGLAALWVASWQEAMPAIDFAARRSWFLAHLKTLESEGAVTICAARGTGELLGFVTVDPATGYLDQLALAPEAKGSGAARLLVAEARKRSTHGLTLEVSQDNLRALRFYQKEGFAIVADGINPQSGLKTWRLHSP